MIQHDLPDLSNRRDIAGIIKNKNVAKKQNNFILTYFTIFLNNLIYQSVFENKLS